MYDKRLDSYDVLGSLGEVAHLVMACFSPSIIVEDVTMALRPHLGAFKHFHRIFLI